MAGPDAEGRCERRNWCIMFTTMETAFICTDELWERGFGGSHPLKPERLKRTYELLMAYRAFDAPNSRLLAPVPASREELLLFHAAEYVDAVARLSGGLSLSKGDVLSLSKGGGGSAHRPGHGRPGYWQPPRPGRSSRCPANCTSPER